MTSLPSGCGRLASVVRRDRCGASIIRGSCGSTSTVACLPSRGRALTCIPCRNSNGRR